MKTKPNTLRSIAEQLNVSTATISNAFNRPDQLSKVKREEILSACKELGYFGPNKAAQSLRRGRSGIIALVLADSIDYMISDPVASSFIRGVSEIVKEHDSHLLLFSGSSTSINSVIDFVDGFICYGTPRNPKLLKELERCPKKVITVDFEIQDRASVIVDNYQAAYEIALKALTPNDSVAIVGLRITNDEVTTRVNNTSLANVATSVGYKRYEGYLKAMSELGIELDTSLVWNVPESTQEHAKKAALDILDGERLPDTILCMSDLIALSILKELLSAGVKVPEQVKIVGFDGIEETKRHHPILSTVYQNSTEKGRMAAHLFKSKEPTTTMLDYHILEGESC